MMFIALFFLSFCPPETSRAEEIKISPQLVVSRILGEGRQSKTIDLQAQTADVAYYNTMSSYDWIFSGSGSYSDDKALLLSGSGNLRDKTSIWTLGMSKRISTGTTVAATFTRTLQNSTFRPSSSSTLRSPYAVYDVGEFTLTQDLLGNFFGIAERRLIEVAEQGVQAAELTKKEQQEQLVLDALKLFWDTYVAKEGLKEAISQRDKYQDLVKEVANKSHVGFANAGDLPKAKAELGAQVRNVKVASYSYLENLDKLLTDMRMDEADRNIAFEVNESLPPLPTMVMPALEDLRAVIVDEVSYESAALTKKATDLASDWPELTFVAGANYTGLESSQGKAFASMTSGHHPEYSVGLNLSYRFFSQKYRADKTDAGVKYELAYNQFLRQKEEQKRILSAVMEKVKLTYASAVSAIEEQGNWEKAVREQEKSYRQGRLDFSQLIQDYNSYFRSRSTRIRAIGDYQIALHAYAAAVDQLVK